MINHVAITNWSSHPDDDVVYWVEAIRQELPAFCAAWGLRVPGIQFYSRDAQFQASEAIMCSVVDDDGLDSTLGYHSMMGGVPLFLSEYRGGSTTLSHEVFETLANPMLSKWATAPDGSRWPVEVCDACQGDTYSVPVTLYGLTKDVQLSNWLRPEFFNLRLGGGPCDRMGVCQPFQLRPGGYTIREQPDGSSSFVWGSAADILPSNRSCVLDEQMHAGRLVRKRLLQGVR